MTQKRKRTRIRLKGVIRLLIIIFVIVFSIMKLIEWNRSDKDATYTLAYDEINVVGNYDALVIRDELMLIANASGKITQIENDGAHVKVNQNIMTITGVDAEDMDSTSQIETEAISAEFQMTQTERDEIIEQMKVDIAELVREGSYEAVDELSKRLALEISTRQEMSETNADLVSLSLGAEHLEVGESTAIITSVGGTLTYYIDGHEELFRYNNITNLNLDGIDDLDLEAFIPSPLYVQEGEVIGKIVNDTDYYLMIVVNQNEYNQFDLYKDILIDVGNKTIRGSIENFISVGNKVAIPIKVNEYIDDFYKNRRIPIEIKQESYQGLKVEKSSIIKSDDGYGVYVVDKLKKVSFMPIKIIRYYEDVAIVKRDFYYEFVEDDRKKVTTVSIYDRVVKNHEDYKPGDVIK